MRFVSPHPWSKGARRHTQGSSAGAGTVCKRTTGMSWSHETLSEVCRPVNTEPYTGPGDQWLWLNDGAIVDGTRVE